MPGMRAVELLTVVGDDCVWEAESSYDVFPYEMLNFNSGDCCQSLGFELLKVALPSHQIMFPININTIQ